MILTLRREARSSILSVDRKTRESLSCSGEVSVVVGVVARTGRAEEEMYSRAVISTRLMRSSPTARPRISTLLPIRSMRMRNCMEDWEWA